MGGRARLVSMILAPALLASAGCGDTLGNLSGRVSYNGKQVVYGSVVALARDSVPRRAAIQDDGTYRIENVPAGEVKLAVFGEPPPVPTLKALRGGPVIDPSKPVRQGPGPEPGARVVDPEKWIPLPTSLSNPDSSKLRTVVQKGENTFDLVMTGEDLPLPDELQKAKAGKKGR